MAVHIVKGDTVVLRRGKEKGKRGIVKIVYPKKGTALVEGINVVKRHSKQAAAGPRGSRQSGIFEKEAQIPLSALMVIDPKTSEPTRVRRAETPEGRRRVAQSGEILLVPAKGR
ncbi:MAG: 50S ribosomal protein L24 [Candidatus Eremiobacteraeota bacterium]|nr:50S ribosomal protein L24 [Candidatus Eremiobacteraeota bacterium]